MMRFNSLLVLLVVSIVSLVLSGAALAQTQCQCNDGTTVISMNDFDDACHQACSSNGGGQTASSDDDDDDDGDDDVVVDDVRRPRGAGRHPARMR